MASEKDKQEYDLSSMNCKDACLVFSSKKREQIYAALVRNHLVTGKCRENVFAYQRKLSEGASEETLANIGAALIKEQPQITAAIKEVDEALANRVESETSDLPGLVKGAISTLLGAIKENGQWRFAQPSGRLDLQ